MEEAAPGKEYRELAGTVEEVMPLDLMDMIDPGEREVVEEFRGPAIQVDILNMRGQKIGVAANCLERITEQEDPRGLMVVTGISVVLRRAIFWGHVDTDAMYNIVVSSATGEERLRKTEMQECMITEFTRPTNIAIEINYEEITFACKRIVGSPGFRFGEPRLNGLRPEYNELALGQEKTTNWLERWRR
jgi:hypothetical protein